jgi:hypothetical protein
MNSNIERNSIFNLEIHDQENISVSSNSDSIQNDNTNNVNNTTSNINTNARSGSSSSSIASETDVNNNNYNSNNNRYNNRYNNPNNNPNNNRIRCRECNYFNTRYRPRSIEIDRDRFQYLEMYRDIDHERQRERERQRDRNILHQIYNDLLHQNNLLQSMRIDINNIWNLIRLNDEYMRSRYQPYNNNPNPPTHPNNRQSGTTNQRININGIPYILENIQQFTINSRTNSTSTAPTTDFIDSFMNLMDFQSNVPVIPTRQQMLNATREIQFGDIENPINTTCPISLETFQESDTITQILHCGHNFNTRQLNTWFQSNVRCPMCRYDIRDYNDNTNEPLNSNRDNNDLDVTLETTQESHPPQPTASTARSSIGHSERRTRTTPRRIFSETPSFETNFNNVANNLSSIALNSINELFERNNNNFTENRDSRFLFDPSNNILLFETLINNSNRFSNINSRSNSNNDNPEPRNIV